MTRSSLLPAGTKVVGEIRGKGDLVVEGIVEGPIHLDGRVLIDVEGLVRGEIRARSLVIRGELQGPAIALESIRLEVGARMVGDARAERVSVVDGAALRGRIAMGAQDRKTSAGKVEAVRSDAATGLGNATAKTAPGKPSAARTAADLASPASRRRGRSRKPTPGQAPEPTVPPLGRRKARRKAELL